LRGILRDRRPKDHENDQSNHRVTLLCVLHLALTSCKRVGRLAAIRFRIPHTPEGSDTMGIAGRHLPTHSTSKIQYYKIILIRTVVWGLSYMDHME
jgi:hypothetical protein